MLRTLCKGDAVKACIDGVEETVDVVEVDRFERTVVVEQHEQGQRLTKVKACLVSELEDETISEVTNSETSNAVATEWNSECNERMTFFKCPQTEVEVGEVVEATPLGIKMAVKEIYYDDEVFRCGGNVVNDGSLTDFALSGPVEKVKKCDNYKVQRQDRLLLNTIKHETFQECLLRSRKNFEYRKLIRLHQLRQLGRHEVRRALTGKARVRSFSFGLVSLDTDFELFEMDVLRKKKVFTPWNGCMHVLDAVLGEGWDLLKEANCFYFVTQFVISCTA
ncbi:hypothetical protein HOLleu_03424 [Holothuria leucospilota]|uniref:Uncharacterized protein n=1 Tax=Holothuria leucospilota TaxID=206669 RepID=A0A9Q1CTM0_HOLLE|nr:hypothetical protein HOLleu_03424 [Holothuria leucospilota]